MRIIKNQRCVAGGDITGTVVHVTETALGKEVMVESDYGPVIRTYIGSAIEVVEDEQLPTFAVTMGENGMVFCASEPYPSFMKTEELSDRLEGNAWYRTYTPEEPKGLSLKVRLASLMEITPQQFDAAKGVQWKGLPIERVSRLSDLGL